MTQLDVTVEICGMSGDGTIAAGGLLNAAMSLAGFSLMAFDSYPAEIRGFGRCVTRTRIRDEEVTALGDASNVLISLDDTQSRLSLANLAQGAMIFFDNNPASYLGEDQSIAAHVEPDAHLFGLPLVDLAIQSSGSPRGRNLTALGGFAAVCQVDPECFRRVIAKKFKGKGEKVLEANLKSFEAGFRYGQEHFQDRKKQAIVFPRQSVTRDRVLVSGNQAIAQAGLDGGIKLYFGYPITPATPIMESLAATLPEQGGRVVQMEDEIASIGGVIGSYFAGKRAMTATSGPGLALMTEFITYAVMIENPAVIIDAQRGGPSTGLPTKTEQSDLQAAVFGGPGDSARIVIAPTDVTECYFFVLKSFQLAERYQVPVIVLTDFFLDNRVEDVNPLQAKEEQKADWNQYPEAFEPGQYKRFAQTRSGVSPRAVPGMEGTVFHATGLEHTEAGLPDYTPENHSQMSEKRHRKIESALADLFVPQVFAPSGRLQVGVIAWGSTFGAALEAVVDHQSRGFRVGALKVSTLFPFHREIIQAFMHRCERVLIPELNQEGQLATLIGHLYTGEVDRLNQVTGTPLPVSRIFTRIEQLLNKGP